MAGRTAIVAVAKNEGVYLHEWIAYHRLLGFDEILLYDNDSTDGSAEMLEQLAANDMVTPIPWHVAPDVSPQRAGYEDALERLGEDFGWVGFIDLDEFFVLPRHETIHEFLAELGDRDALGVNWKNFGSSGRERYGPEPVIDRFRRCSARDYGRNARVKVLARTSAVARPGVHSAKLKQGASYLDVTGEPIRDGRSASVNHDLIRLNHYYTKSLEEWAWKAARGRGGKPESLGDRKHWYPDFAPRDRNEEEESDIVRLLPRLRELMTSTAVTAKVTLPPAVRPGAPLQPERDIVDEDSGGAERTAQEALPALKALGWIHSRRAKRPIDANRRPIPWYTYPAIAFVEERVRPDMDVFEFGSGFSTLWWADKVGRVTAVEHEERWVRKMVEAGLPDNVDLMQRELETDGDYCRSAQAAEGAPFHVVVIDGRDRVNCAINSVSALRDDGVIIWDNANRAKYRPGFDFLANKGFRRLPFSGMGPQLARIWETSVFYRPDNCFGL